VGYLRRKGISPPPLPQRRADPREGGLDVGARVEGADAHVALAAFAEAGAGRADEFTF
jgi:hypothetical protein